MNNTARIKGFLPQLSRIAALRSILFNNYRLKFAYILCIMTVVSFYFHQRQYSCPQDPRSLWAVRWKLRETSQWTRQVFYH